MKWFLLLLATSASAQVHGFWTSTWSKGSALPMGGIRFDARTEPASPALPFVGNSSGRTVYGPLAGYSAVHRYFQDDTDFLYFGYDVLVESGAQPDTFKISFFELAIGPLDFAMGRNGVVTKPSDWKKLLPPPLPAPQQIHTGDTVEVTVWADSMTGQKLVDVLQVQQPLRRPGTMGLPRPGGPIRSLPPD